jgi:hypothetical protein
MTMPGLRRPQPWQPAGFWRGVCWNVRKPFHQKTTDGYQHLSHAVRVVPIVARRCAISCEKSLTKVTSFRVDSRKLLI